ncbi:MAG TPA: heterodisulfide reductase-related iron-sulfur binding cluster [Abditibacteriaceae bacterium]|nr:heterodisulfide reductase-related iron-sulfur binding cluster [Abditibacteriaceae bacterium]
MAQNTTLLPIELRDQTPARTSVHIDHERLMDCIHCGLCLSQCPTYAEEGLEADSPRGRIYIMRSLAEGRSEPTPSLVEHLDLCLGCRACETACPSGVQYGHLLEGTRAHLREHYKRPRRQRIIGKIVEATFPYPNRMELALLPVRVLRRTGVLPLLHRIGFMKMLGNLGDLERLLPPLPPIRKRLNFPERWRARGQEQARTGMITGCVMQVMQTPVNEATARVLTKAGCSVAAPKSQVCCGALHAHVGAMDMAREFAKKNIEVFETWQQEHGELDAIIINAAGCGAALKEYTGWFKDDAEWETRARSFCEKVKDVAEFLARPQYQERLTALMQPNPQSQISNPKSNDAPREALPNTAGGSTLRALDENLASQSDDQNLAGEPDNALSAVEATNGQRPHDPHQPPAETSSTAPAGKSKTKESSQRRATYHDACHLAHGQSIRDEPRDLLAWVPGLEMVPLQESEMCCGSAGSYNITQPAMAMQLLERKMKHIAATGANVVITGNPGCMMQIMLGAQKFGVPVEVKHPVEILDAATKD